MIINEPTFFKTLWLVYKPTTKNKRMADHLSKVPAYRPNPLLPGPMVKMALVFRSKFKLEDHYDREIFGFEDEGRVAVDFHPKMEVMKSCLSVEEMRKRPVVIMITGLSGDSTDRYLMDTCVEFWEKKRYRCVVANRRGVAGIEVSGKYPFSWIRYEDLDVIIEELQARNDFKQANFYMLGFSMGANFVHYYAGEKAKLGHEMKIKGAISISATPEMATSQMKLSKKFFIDPVLLAGVKGVCHSHRHNPKFMEAMKVHGVTFGKTIYPSNHLDDIDGARSMYEFDDRVASKWFGKRTADEYYYHYSPNRRLKFINIPTLCISSLKDELIE